MNYNDAYKLPQNSYNKDTQGEIPSELFFNNLIWMTSKDTAKYLRKSVNAIRILVYKRNLKARKFNNRLYFRRDELDELLETSFLKGGFHGDYIKNN
ncbi:MAG: helix-turn-helix domain-containing protein [Bacteriovoracaceae bacterium]|nr:helix-turn-helix domain-containing protein [Bacteriovoracaceae bacterium]